MPFYPVDPSSGGGDPDLSAAVSQLSATVGDLQTDVTELQNADPPSPGGFIGNWSAGTYGPGSLVKSSGVIYGTSTTTTDVPQIPVTNYSNDFSNDAVPSQSYWAYSQPSGQSVGVVSGSTITSSVVSGSLPSKSLRMVGGVAWSSGTMTLTLTFTSGGTITFSDSKAGETWDIATFKIDGATQHGGSASNWGWTARSYNVAAGTHTFTWQFDHDSGNNGAPDSYGIANLATTNTSISGGSWEVIGYALDVPNVLVSKGDMIVQTSSGASKISAGSNDSILTADSTQSGGVKWAKPKEVIMVAVTDETTAITTGTSKISFRMPYAMTLTEVRASLNTASSSGNPAIDINESGVSIFSTTLTIDATETTSKTAAVPAVISDASLADDAVITVDIDTAGTGATGLKICLIGTRS